MTQSVPEWNLPWHGACRCGAVTLRIGAPPILTMACHCRGCQKMTGGAFSLSVAIPEAGFAAEGATPVRGGARTEGQNHMHCPECLSWIFTTFDAPYGFVNVRATMLDEAAQLAPFVETQTDEKLPFVHLDTPLSFPRFPDMDEIGEASRRYADEAPCPGPRET
jgi:hypothetical protein